MATPLVVIDGCALVVRGIFNPAIVSPAWLLHVGLISPEQFTDSEVGIVSEDVSAFRSGWAEFQVSRDFLQVSTSEAEEFERLRDLLVGILNTLRHTPISALGINRHAHLEAPDVETWHVVGDTLSPKAVWDGVLKLPGTQSLTLLGVRSDQHLGRIQVQVEPSTRVANGIYVAHNDHYGLDFVEKQPESRLDFGATKEPEVVADHKKIGIAVEVLTDGWQASMTRAQAVIQRMWDVIAAASKGMS